MIRGLLEDIAIVSSREVMRPSNPQIVEDWLRDNLRGTQAERESLAALAGMGSQTDDLDALLAEVARRIVAGRVLAVRLEKPLPRLDPPQMVDLVDLAEDEPVAPLRPEPEPATTWVEIEVVDDEGGRYPRLPITLEFSDGSTRATELDASSRCRVDDVPEGGRCRIEFAEALEP